MSNLLQRIKTDSIDARKRGDKLRGTLLTTLYAEALAVGKNNGNRESTDEEVIKTIRKFAKNNEEAASIPNIDVAAYNILAAEYRILNEYLPPELTDDQIKEAIDYVSVFQTLSMKSMGAVKSRIDELHPGAYDGKRVSEALKKRINV